MFATLSRYPLVAVFYHPDAIYAQKLIQACYDGGMRVVEFTNRGPEAAAVFMELRAYSSQHLPDLKLGIGTIYTANEAEQFIDLGADFVVQPVTTSEVGAVCKRRDIPWIPGAMTPNEIYAAQQLGAKVVKVFPGVVLGPAFVKTLRGPMPDVPLMVNGGMEATLENLQEWFGAGANAMGIGASAFFSDREMQDFDSVSEKVAELMEYLQAQIIQA